MINAIKIRFETALFDQTVEFYTKIIGLRAISEFEDEKGVILSVTNKQSEGFLEIVFSETPKNASQVSLQFRTSDIDHYVKNLRGDIHYEGPKTRPWGSRYVYLKDPNGVPVIVFEGSV